MRKQESLRVCTYSIHSSGISSGLRRARAHPASTARRFSEQGRGGCPDVVSGPDADRIIPGES